MLNKVIVRVNNLKEVNTLKEKGISNFLFPLEKFSIGYQTFTLEEIKDLKVNIYLLINREFDNITLNEFKKIKDLSFVKGIFFEDIAVYMLLKGTGIPLIWSTMHFVINSRSINFWLAKVCSARLSNELTKEEIQTILKNVTKPVVLDVYGQNIAMYSRRKLLSNFFLAHQENPKENLTLTTDNHISFKTFENEYGTVFFYKTSFNYTKILEEIDDSKILLYLYDIEDNTPEELLDIINKKEITSFNRFLEEPTIYKLEAKKWLNYFHQQVMLKKWK